MENAEGTLWITDQKLQDGKVLTGWEHSTQEILKPWIDSPMEMHQCIVRGERELHLINEGETEGYMNWTITADTDIHIPKSVENQYRGEYSLEFGMGNRTRNIRIREDIQAGDVFKFEANPLRVTKNGQPFNNYKGLYLGAPGDDLFYFVSIPGEQTPWSSFSRERVIPGHPAYPDLVPQTDKRVSILLERTPRELAYGGQRM